MVAEVKDDATLIQPGATAPHPLGVIDADGGLLLEQIRRCRSPVDSGPAGVEGLPVAEGGEGNEVGGGVGAAREAHHLAGVVWLVVVGVTIEAQAEKGCCRPGGRCRGRRRRSTITAAAIASSIRRRPWLGCFRQLPCGLPGRPVGIGQVPALRQVRRQGHQL